MSDLVYDVDDVIDLKDEPLEVSAYIFNKYVRLMKHKIALTLLTTFQFMLSGQKSSTFMNILSDLNV